MIAAQVETDSKQRLILLSITRFRHALLEWSVDCLCKNSNLSAVNEFRR